MSHGYKNKLRTRIWIWIMILTALAVSSAISVNAAHFICGEVMDARDGTSPDWRTVYIYQDDISVNTSCEVSPIEQRYCCDLEYLNPGWTIGENVRVIMPEDDSGFYADAVYTVTSGNGYDAAPVMGMDGIIIIENLKSAYDTENVSLDVTIKDPYSYRVLYELNNAGKNEVCQNCNSATIELTELAEGDYTIRIYAETLGGIERSVSKVFAVDLPDPPLDNCGDYSCSIGKVNICHRTGSSAERTLCINIDAVSQHLDHGDYCGICTGGSGQITGFFNHIDENKTNAEGESQKSKHQYKSLMASLVPGREYKPFVDLEDSTLKSVNLWVRNEIDSASIILKEKTDAESSIESFAGYSAIELITDLDIDDVAKVEYEFAIEKSWVEDQGAAAGQIVVLNSKDQQVEIIELNEEGSYYFVAVRSNLLGVLKIGVIENMEALQKEPYQEIPSVLQEIDRRGSNVTRADILQEQIIRQYLKGLILFFALILIVVAVVFVVLMIYVKKRTGKILKESREIKRKIKSRRMKKRKKVSR